VPKPIGAHCHDGAATSAMFVCAQKRMEQSCTILFIPKSVLQSRNRLFLHQLANHFDL